MSIRSWLRDRLGEGSAVEMGGRGGGPVSNLESGQAGTSSRSSQFTVQSWITLDQLRIAYNEVDLAAKVVDILPEDATRRGVDIAGLEEAPRDSLRAAMRDMRILDHVQEAAKLSRQFGDGYLLLIDGADPAGSPGDELLGLRAIGGDLIQPDPDFIDRNFGSPTFGQPQLFLMVNGREAPIQIAPERLIRIMANPVPLRGFQGKNEVLLYNTTDNVIPRKPRTYCARGDLYKALSVIKDEADGLGDGRHLMAEASVMMIDAGKDVNEQNAASILDKFRLIRQGFSNHRLLPLPSGSSAERLAVSNLAGVAAMLKANLDRVAVAVDIPTARLLGEQATGLNASTESSIKLYAAKVGDYQTNKLTPVLDALLPYLLRRAGLGEQSGLSWTWPSFLPLSTKEEAEILASNASTLNSRIAALNNLGGQTETRFNEETGEMDTVEREAMPEAEELRNQVLGNVPVTSPIADG